MIREKTGLVLDPYFSGTKVQWLLDNVPSAREQASKGTLAFGTIDTFLIWRLTGGTHHVTDVSNASRTMLLNLRTVKWDPELLDLFRIPVALLPEVRQSSEIYGTTKNLSLLPDGIPISGIAGDQQAALFGQACFRVGESKCTYGTGAFLVLNTGKEIKYSKNGLLTTIAWGIDNQITYALEGSVFIAGAAVQWLRDGLKIINNASEIEALARSVDNSGDVVFVPAFVGLGAPYWNDQVRGTIFGLSRGTSRAHIARATLESIALQCYDVFSAMEEDLGQALTRIKVDGGACKNDLLMQFQSNLLQKPILRPKVIETTGLGAALLAGLSVGMWKDLDTVTRLWQVDREFLPSSSTETIRPVIDRWHELINRIIS
jgi:glycerol kinase